MYRFLILFTILFFGCRKDQKPQEVVATSYVLKTPAILKQYLPNMIIPSDNLMTEEGVELGRKLFYDPILSGDNTQSCSSCHGFNTTFTDTAQFSTGIDGNLGTRNSMAIINLGWGKSFFWDGRASSLEDQAFGPVVNPVEMHNTWGNAVEQLNNNTVYVQLFKDAFGDVTIDSVMVSKAIAQFERTLMSGNSVFDRYLRGEPTGLTEAEELEIYQGFSLFMDETKGDCFHCHGDSYNPLWTDNLFHNNGLDASFTDLGLGDISGDANDNGKFKTPTLRNLKYSAPYMHDGRFTTLMEVVEHYSSGLTNSSTIDPLMKNLSAGGAQLSPLEKQLLVKFLESLSDQSFIENPDFQAP